VKRIALFSAAVLLFWTACADQPVGPRAPLTRPSAALTQNLVTATVCVAYGKELEKAKGPAAASPDNAGLQERVDALSAVIADACR
jgi:hypothetical protein